MGMRWMKANPKWIMSTNFMPAYMTKNRPEVYCTNTYPMTFGVGCLYQIIDS